MAIPESAPAQLISTVEGVRSLPVDEGPTGGLWVQFDAPEGIYQLSVIMDAREFDWEQLYEVLDRFGNVNQRTGPWDFSINHNSTPLVPSYWVSVNGSRIGLWFFQRVTLEDIEGRRFRGNMSIYASGPTVLELEPFVPHAEGMPDYSRAGLRWVSAVLEADPEDSLEPLPDGIRDGTHSPAAGWQDEAFWARLRGALETSHALYSAPLERAFDWVMAKGTHDANDVLVLLAAHRIGRREGALSLAVAALDALISAPTWGNPNPEGYSHNGDMGPMYNLRALAWAHRMMPEELGADRHARLLAKLRLQGEIFFHLALLNRDYWGGSVIQGHGWVSMFGFGAVALAMLGSLPEAERWVRYVLPRLRRSVAAMPLDGVVPMSSHQHLYLYLDELTQYRDALLAQTGEDLFDQPQFAPIVSYIANALDEKRQQWLTVGYDVIRYVGGNHFLNRMASHRGDRLAAYLQARLLEVPETEFYHGTQVTGYYLGAVIGALSYDPAVAPVAGLPSTTSLVHYADSGQVHYRDDPSGVVLSVHCGPYSGYNSDLRSLCPCDRLGTAPGEGHFALYLDGVPVLCSPDCGYGLRTVLRSCLLIDGQGQYGDVGYPMSIPGKRHRGEQVQCVRWDEASRTGLVRLHLQPAYPESLGVSAYTRDLLVSPTGITCRDTVTLDEPRRLSWLFQGKEEYGVALEGSLAGCFGSARRLRIRPVAAGVELAASVCQTPVVWSYASVSGFRPFAHVRYDTVGAARFAVVDFMMTWDPAQPEP